MIETSRWSSPLKEVITVMALETLTNSMKEFLTIQVILALFSSYIAILSYILVYECIYVGISVAQSKIIIMFLQKYPQHPREMNQHQWKRMVVAPVVVLDIKCIFKANGPGKDIQKIFPQH